MENMRKFCDRAVVIDCGKNMFLGIAQEAVEKYQRIISH